MSDLMTSLKEYINKRIAIYGLSEETGRLLPELVSSFQVVGLLDGYKTEGELYGKPIISLESAIDSGAALILVVARPGSCKAIAKRIGAVCREHGIALFDIRGNDLCREKKVTYHFKGIEGISREELRRMLMEHEVISVDLFDTLVMRQVLFPTDIFTLVDCRLKEEGIHIDGFCGKRLESEKYMSRLSAPTLEEIYQYMIDTYDIPGLMPDYLAGLEWSIDHGVLVPRRELCDLLREVHSLGKEIYIVSDTFYRKEQLACMLDDCGIDFYKDIMASCEYGTGKTRQLFAKLKERIGTNLRDTKLCGTSLCLHIGDDLAADIEGAERNGLDACRIYSGIDLLDMSGYLGLWDRIDTFSDRVKTGMFVARLFNSPFQFETEERKISVSDAEDIGYLFFAPMISDFTLWLDGQVRDCGIENVWLCARDGYLIKKLYDKLLGEKTSVYFLTSRTAAIRAGMETKKDIAYVGSMKYSGPLSGQISERFGVDAVVEDEGASLLDYSEEILEHSVRCRKNYRKYIEKLNLAEGDIAFFDFVARGTCQMYVSRLTDRRMKGFYFLLLEEEQAKEMGLDITSFYQQEEREGSTVFDNYYIMETMLTAPEPSVQEFDEEGEPVYAEETRAKADLDCFLHAQEGVCGYFQTYLKVCPEPERRIGKGIDEVFLAMVHKISIQDRGFLNLKVEDPFFNRMTDITDLI